MTIFRFTVVLQDLKPMVIDIPEVNKKRNFYTTPEIFAKLGRKIVKEGGLSLLVRSITMEQVYVRDVVSDPAVSRRLEIIAEELKSSLEKEKEDE